MSETAGLILATATSFVVWLALLALAVVATKPGTVHAGAPSLELVGGEPPAVVNLLTHHWKLGGEAAAATLLDLAARHAVALEQVALERYVVRVRSRPPDDLMPHEQQLLEHVRAAADADGVVPCEALSTGTELKAEAWWKAFESAVQREARRLGLSRPRWHGLPVVTVAIAAIAPILLAGLASTAATHEGGTSFATGAFAMAVLLCIVAGPMGGERDTPTGQAAASRWLGFASMMHEDANFVGASPAAVQIWDRHLAYGAAVGAAPAAVRALRLGEESKRVAWSAYGGHWQQLRINYPGWRPGWGRHPTAALVRGLTFAAFGFTVAALALNAARQLSDADGADIPAPIMWASASVIAIGFAIVAVRGVMEALLGFADLAATREVEGVVVRVFAKPNSLATNGGSAPRRVGSEAMPYLAVFDGHSTRIDAWLVTPRKLGAVEAGDHVRIGVTPRLGYVRELAVLTLEKARV